MAKEKSPKKRANSIRRPARAGKSAPTSEKVRANVKSSFLKIPRKWLGIAGAALVVLAVILAGIFWFYKVYADPQKVFWGMVGNNLSTVGVTRETSEPSCLPVNVPMTNVIQLSFAPDTKVHCITDITNGNIKLTIESIGTLQNDYERYTKIDKGGTNKQNAKYQKVYDMWLKNNGAVGSVEPSLYAVLLNQPVLFGNFSGGDKDKLVADLKTAYKPDFDAVNIKTEGWRRVYTYNVTLNMKQFAKVEKEYAQQLKLPSASRINPANYPEDSKAQLTFTVDVLSRQIKKLSYSGVNDVYEGYGLSGNVQIPVKTVSGQQLQRAFQLLQ